MGSPKTKLAIHLLVTHTATPHQRFGNERAWSVFGEGMHKGQIVTLHAMCSKLAAIKKAIAQDEREHATGVSAAEEAQGFRWPNCVAQPSWGQ